ncbi:MAG: 2-hydroxyacid dehydrogenase [Steroidobacteraceae bacterium]
MEPVAALSIALLWPPQGQQSQLESLLDFPHRFLEPTPHRQPVDALVSLRFGRGEAERFEPRLLHLPGAGADAVDFALLGSSCTVCNVYEHEIPVAEYVLAAILNHATGYPDMIHGFTSTGFGKAYASRRQHGEIHGKTLGLVGYGHIGKLVAQRAQAFGMRVHAVSRSGRAPGAEHADTIAGLHTMLRAADFVVIACPLTAETRGLIGTAELAAMKPTAILINIGRAAVVDEDALYDALAAGRIGGATLDVWYQYPTPEAPDSPPARRSFEDLPNVHCTTHSCAWTREMIARRLTVIAANLKRLHSGLPLLNVIRAASDSPIDARREPT